MVIGCIRSKSSVKLKLIMSYGKKIFFSYNNDVSFAVDETAGDSPKKGDSHSGESASFFS